MLWLVAEPRGPKGTSRPGYSVLWLGRHIEVQGWWTGHMASDITNWAAISSGFQMLPWPGRPFCGWGGPAGSGRNTVPTPSQVGGGQERDSCPRMVACSAASGDKQKAPSWGMGPGGLGRGWSQVTMATLDLAVTPSPCHPGGSWALRVEVKNTRQTLVLSKVKCVTRQREELKITCVYTQQCLGFPSPPTPPFLANPRNPSVAARGTARPKSQGIQSP